MKICLVTNLYPPTVQGGAEIYVARLARALAQEHRVTVITSEAGFHPAPHREFSPEGVTVYRLGPINIAHLTRLPHHLVPQSIFRAVDAYHPQIAANVAGILDRERPDLVHIHNWVGLSLAATVTAARRRAPLAITLHDYSLFCAYASIRHPDGHTCRPDLPCGLLAAVNRYVARFLRLAISPSHYVLDEHTRRGFFRHAIHQILPYGLESALTSSPLPSFPSPSGGGQGGGLKKTFDVLFMGRVQSHKGIEVLIHAFRRTTDAGLRLHVAGTGPCVEACKTLAASDDRIRFYGFVSGEMRRSLLENADCMVLPSLWPDNYPVSIQEAFASGPVVIASMVGGIPEMVHDGVNGLLVQPGDEAGIVSAIERLRQSPELAARLRASAKETARLYDMRFHTDRLIDAYRQLLTSSRSGDLDRAA